MKHNYDSLILMVSQQVKGDIARLVTRLSTFGVRAQQKRKGGRAPKHAKIKFSCLHMHVLDFAEAMLFKSLFVSLNLLICYQRPIGAAGKRK